MISIKKVGTVAAAAGLFAVTAMPAFAATNVGVGNGNVLQGNFAPVTTNVGQGANTGNNTTGAGLGVNRVRTGDASNVAIVGTSVNSNDQSTCGCPGTSTVNVGAFNGNVAQGNFAPVTTNVGQGANTGGNTTGALLGVNRVRTGNASNGAAVVTVVNSNVN